MRPLSNYFDRDSLNKRSERQTGEITKFHLLEPFHWVTTFHGRGTRFSADWQLSFANEKGESRERGRRDANNAGGQDRGKLATRLWKKGISFEKEQLSVPLLSQDKAIRDHPANFLTSYPINEIDLPANDTLRPFDIRFSLIIGFRPNIRIQSVFIDRNFVFKYQLLRAF